MYVYVEYNWRNVDHFLATAFQGDNSLFFKGHYIKGLCILFLVSFSDEYEMKDFLNLASRISLEHSVSFKECINQQ